MNLHLTGHHAGHRRGRTAILHAGDVDGRHRLEQLEREQRSGAAGGVVELARIYGGTLDLEDSELGGLAARLLLPGSVD